MASASAAVRVTNTMELLELILLHLPLKDLLLAQLINTSFKATIASSQPLQSALFFQSSSEGQEAIFISNANDTTGEFTIGVRSLESNIHVSTRVFLNPLLLIKFPWLYNLFRRDPTSGRSSAFFNRIDTDLTAAVSRPEASWRCVLVTQPPLRGLTATIFRYTDRRTGVTTSDVPQDGKLKEPYKMEHLRTGLVKYSEESKLFLKVGGKHLFEV